MSTLDVLRALVEAVEAKDGFRFIAAVEAARRHIAERAAQPPPTVSPRSREVLPYLLEHYGPDLRRSGLARLDTTHAISTLADMLPRLVPDAAAYLQGRITIGVDTYGVPLMTRNGRPALLDATEEIADALLYFTQARMEGRDDDDEIG